MDVKDFEKFSPCDWSPAMRYLYVKKYGRLPDECRKCWKPLAFFDDEGSLNMFVRRLKSLKPNFHYKSVTRGIVAYAHSVEERERILEIFRKIVSENAINCRILWRQSGRYWQDMFPELFGKEVNDYKPFYSDEFKFRKLADEAKTQEEVEAVEKEIFGIDTKIYLERLTSLYSALPLDKRVRHSRVQNERVNLTAP